MLDLKNLVLSLIAASSFVYAEPEQISQNNTSSVLSIEQFSVLAAKCANRIPLDTLSSLIKTESKFCSLAISVDNGETICLENKENAIDLLKNMEAEHKSYWIGLGQISSKRISFLKLNSEDLLDSCINLNTVEKLLIECYREQAFPNLSYEKQLRNTLSCYFDKSEKTGIRSHYIASIFDNAEPIFAIPPISFLKELNVENPLIFSIKNSAQISPKNTQKSQIKNRPVM